MTTSKDAFIVVAKVDGRVVGFAAATTRVGGFYRDFLRRRGLRSALLLVGQVKRPQVLFKIAETLLYPARPRHGLPAAELLSVVVASEHRQRDLGRQLFEHTRAEFARRGVERFKVVVGSGLEGARAFYTRMGGTLHGSLEVHRGTPSVAYVWPP